MAAQSGVPHGAQHFTSEIKSGIANRAAQIVIGAALLAAILFLASGRLDWPWAWAMLGLYLTSITINMAFLLRHSPETAAERGRTGDMRGWDKIISGLWSVMQFLLLPLIAALDERFGWTGPLALWLHVAGGLIFALGLALFGWAMIANAYFATIVRIQVERGHVVCDTGPYRFVRHPGYVGTFLQSLGAPLLLGSTWALVPGVLAIALIVVRTIFEDRVLQQELAGYNEYAGRVRWRLVPGVW
jgi:protein-S-isoprenylcysteine O-methyltransferase Ste14